MEIKDNDVDRLCDMVKECYDMCNQVLGTRWIDNPIYKNLKHMVTIVDRIRLERIKEENKILYDNLIGIGYIIASEDSNDVLNEVRVKLLYLRLESFYKLLMNEVGITPTDTLIKVELLMDKEEDILTIMISDDENRISSATIVKLFDFVDANKYVLQLKFKI